MNIALTYDRQIESKSLEDNAKTACHKETYKLVEKTSTYRIGVGARAPSTEVSSFFVEIIISLSSKAGKVNLLQLEKTLACLKSLQEQGYTLTFEDSTCISCEKKLAQNLNDEYAKVKSFLKPLE